MTEIRIETLLEATLFSAGKSLTPGEFAESLGYDEDEIIEAMSNLQSTLKRRRGGALQIVEIGGRWAVEVKPSIAGLLPSETKTEMPQKLLKAAALIAYHQPMHQSRLVELLGQRAYDHIRELAQSGLINRRRDGNTRRLTTTRRFSEVFGCPHTDRKKVRIWFREMVSSSGMLDGMEEKLALQDEEDRLDGVQLTLKLGEEE
jgi:segregation and condensation protein B